MNWPSASGWCNRLQESEQRFHLVFDTSPDAIFLTTLMTHQENGGLLTAIPPPAR